MARMIPATVQFRESPAEGKLFAGLKESLDDSYTVLHHVQWLQKRPGRLSPDGETDFIIGHPGKGALCIEVKGGRVRYDSASGKWASLSRNGRLNEIRDPFKQATDSVYSLIEFTRTLPYWPAMWGPIGHAACFPDGKLDSRPLPHTPPERSSSMSRTCMTLHAFARRWMELSISTLNRRFSPSAKGLAILNSTLSRMTSSNPATTQSRARRGRACDRQAQRAAVRALEHARRQSARGGRRASGFGEDAHRAREGAPFGSERHACSHDLLQSPSR